MYNITLSIGKLVDVFNNWSDVCVQGPLFDVNVLDELCFSDELWANLDLPGNLPTQTPGKPSLLIMFAY